MYKKIIVGLSLEHGLSERAINAAKALGDSTCEIHAVHITEPLQGSVRFHVSDEDLKKARDNTAKTLKQRLSDHPDITPVLLDGHPGQRLAAYAKEIGADCIVIGSHKPGLQDFLLGSTAGRIVRHAPCSVHVLR